VNVLEENQDAVKIFMICRRQVITAGMGDVIDINILAVIEAMGVCKIRNQEECLRKVQKLFNICQQIQKDKESNDLGKQK